MKRDRHSESGIALLIAIFVLLLITAIGAGMIVLTNTEINTSANFRDEQTARFASKSGIEVSVPMLLIRKARRWPHFFRAARFSPAHPFFTICRARE